MLHNLVGNHHPAVWPSLSPARRDVPDELSRTTRRADSEPGLISCPIRDDPVLSGASCAIPVIEAEGSRPRRAGPHCHGGRDRGGHDVLCHRGGATGMPTREGGCVEESPTVKVLTPYVGHRLRPLTTKPGSRRANRGAPGAVSPSWPPCEVTLPTTCPGVPGVG